MIIITDDPAYAFDTVRLPHPFSSFHEAKTERRLKFLTDLLFPPVNLFFSEVQALSSLSSLVIRRYAEASQFDLLVNAGSDESEYLHGIVCFAGSGKKFHGFHQRKWVSLPGNIHLSMSLSPGQKIEKPAVACLLLAANSVIQTIDSLTPLSGISGVHWVNDIVIRGLKVGGVLCQTQMQGEITERIILGIGLNIDRHPRIGNDPCIRGTTALNRHLGDRRPYHISEIFWSLVANLERNYRQMLEYGCAELLDYYLAHSVLPGKKVVVFSDSRDGRHVKIGEGKVTAISEDLELIVEGMNKPLRKGRVRLAD